MVRLYRQQYTNYFYESRFSLFVFYITLYALMYVKFRDDFEWGIPPHFCVFVLDIQRTSATNDEGSLTLHNILQLAPKHYYTQIQRKSCPRHTQVTLKWTKSEHKQDIQRSAIHHLRQEVGGTREISFSKCFLYLRLQSHNGKWRLHLLKI